MGALSGSGVTFLWKRVLQEPRNGMLMLVQDLSGADMPMSSRDRNHCKTSPISPMYNGLQSTIENNSVYTPCSELVPAQEIA